MVLVKRSEFDDDVYFGAKTYDTKLVTQILKAIKIKDNATFYCTNDGVKVTVDDMKFLQANAYLEVLLFDEYKITKKADEDHVKFTCNLSVILECLNILNNFPGGAFTALIITLKGPGHPMKLLMEHNGIITDCKIKILTSEPLLNFNFESSAYVNKIVLFSDSFKEVLNDLDTNSDVLNISILSEPSKFKLTTEGSNLVSETDIPCDCEMVDSFNISSPCHYSYKLNHLKPALKHLPGSLKVSIQINESGILCLQYMIVDDEGKNCFVEYFCSSVFKQFENNESYNYLKKN